MDISVAISKPLILKPSQRRAVSVWLALCLALVVAMVALGGYTRLSGSGLSITEWKPVHGVIPPLSDAEWQEEFDAYRASPQYSQINAGMKLEEFKEIFWPEYFHRLLGRALGFVFLLPLAFFWMRGVITRGFAFRLGLIFALGGAQGGVGWLMVASGLQEGPYVSHIRLAAHLALAFLIFALILWAWLDVRESEAEARPVDSGFARPSLLFILALLSVQIVYGAFMAGMYAGLIYNTFPTMNGAWIPPDILAQSPLHENFYGNIATVQFIHRWLAASLVALYLLWAAVYGRVAARLGLRPALALTLASVGAQFTLGVFTLLHMIPLHLALSHQLLALGLFAFTLRLLHGLRRAQPSPAREENEKTPDKLLCSA